MAQGGLGVSGTEMMPMVEKRRPTAGAPTRQALELVAMRGKDVLGVRHLLDGRAYVGSGSDAVARIPTADLGGGSPMIAEVVGDCHVLRVPAGARARLHEGNGLARLLAGPCEVVLDEKDRAVVVLGSVQVRAQIVAVEIVPRVSGFIPRWGSGRATSDSPGLARWIGLVGALYAAALAICVVLAPRDRAHLEEGAIRRAAAAVQAAVLARADHPVMIRMERGATPQADLEVEGVPIYVPR